MRSGSMPISRSAFCTFTGRHNCTGLVRHTPEADPGLALHVRRRAGTLTGDCVDAARDVKSAGEKPQVVTLTATTCWISFVMILQQFGTSSGHKLARILPSLLRQRCCAEARQDGAAQLEREGWCPQTLRTVEATHRRSRLHVVSL